MNHCNQYCNLQALFGLCTSMLDCVLPTIQIAVRITQNQMLEFPQKQNPTTKLIQQIPDQHPISSVLPFCLVQ
jgi:hypothetical protein